MQKLRDREKEQSEHEYSLLEFVDEYNKSLPEEFPRATRHRLMEFQSVFPHLFKGRTAWTLGEHRKKFMDWLPQHLRERARSD